MVNALSGHKGFFGASIGSPNPLAIVLPYD
jgi:hypothetical protein